MEKCECERTVYNKFDMRYTLHEYIRDNSNRKIGVLLSTVIDGNVCFGWSLANKLDEFDKDIGFMIASDRAYLNLTNRYDKYFETVDKDPESGFEFIDDILPHAVKENLPSFINRMSRYYKDNDYSFLVEYLMSEFLI